MERTVYFRAFEQDDAKLIHQWKNNDELNELTIGLNKKTSMEDDQQWVNNHKDHHPYYAYWAICDIKTDRMIGNTSLINIHYINSSAETGAILIGDPDYNDGFAWIETVLFLFEYAFERLNLNRIYGQSIIGHKISNLVEPLMFMTQEGVLRQATYKNGHYYDISFAGILRSEYFLHKEAGDYEMTAILRRIKKLRNK